MYSKTQSRKHTKGQTDHVDAWLISYADLITLLFMVFVIFVSVSLSKRDERAMMTHGEPVHPYLQQRSGTLALGTPFDEAYRTLVGIVVSHHADQQIALQKTDHGMLIDLSALQFFENGSADIPGAQLPVLAEIAHVLKDKSFQPYAIEVEGHTDDMPLINGKFANNWELAAVRATRIVNLLVSEGIEPQRLKATSYAGNQPLVPNRDVAGNPIPENRNRNQRVVIKLEQSPLTSKVLASL